MNRLIIIGNGFDLAHGLKTSYNDFIDDFWKRILKDFTYPKFQISNQFIEIDIDFSRTRYYISEEEVINKAKQISCFKEFEEFWEFGENKKRDFVKLISYSFKNNFFELICSQRSLNWVDIEDEYYRQLKESSVLSIEQREETIAVLNKEFEEIINLFETYLKEKVETDNKTTLNEISRIFDTKEKKPESQLKEYLEEFPKEDEEDLRNENEILGELIDRDIITKIEDGEINQQTVFLNFNYTSTIKNYFKNGNFRIFKEIQIHGKVGDKYNKINFGFGDEMDDDYKMIENINQNEYLKYFKSFGYLQNSNYKNLLNFIYSGKFQVYIMGHSSGLSDRTLLNTIFEHKNCRSIKVFYYKNDEEKDNYTEIIQNISRHFNDKKQMREKIVHKNLCSYLPQHSQVN